MHLVTHFKLKLVVELPCFMYHASKKVPDKLLVWGIENQIDPK